METLGTGICLVMLSPLLALLLIAEFLFRFIKCLVGYATFGLACLLLISIAAPLVLAAAIYDVSKAIFNLAVAATCGIFDCFVAAFDCLFNCLSAPCSKSEQRSTTYRSDISHSTAQTLDFSTTRSVVSHLKEIDPPSYGNLFRDDETKPPSYSWVMQKMKMGL